MRKKKIKSANDPAFEAATFFVNFPSRENAETFNKEHKWKCLNLKKNVSVQMHDREQLTVEIVH